MTVLVFLGALLAAMALGMPIAYALLVSGAALMWHLDTFDAQILAQNLINGADSFPLLAVPFFMLAGEIMNVGGLSKRIVDLALTLVGHLRGGLGFVAILAGWYVTEIGRQPFIVFGLVKTAEVVSTTSAAHVAVTLAAYVTLYVALIVAYMAVLKYMAEHPVEAATKPPLHSSKAIAKAANELG